MVARFLAGLATVLTSTGLTLAQSINIDIDTIASPVSGGGVPSSAFGAAAGQPGAWNSFFSTAPVPLFDLNSMATSATLAITATSTTNSILSFNNPANTGDFALLLNDGSQIGTTAQGGTRTYAVRGLIDGPYEVYTYTARPSATEGELFVGIPGSAQGEIVSAGLATGNTFTPGVSHVVHTLNVVGGAIDINLRDAAGAPAGYVDGFQLRLVPEPSVAAAIGLAALVTGLRRRRR